MFGRSRATLRALQDVSSSVRALRASVEKLLGAGQVDGSLSDRMDAFELSRAKWEAEMDAALLKADSRYKAASAAESRARTMERASEKIPDGIPSESEETPEEAEEAWWAAHKLPPDDGAGGEADGVQPLPVGVEAGSKAQAMRGKFS